MLFSQRREQARLLQDWKAADKGRVELAKKGIVVIDTENGQSGKEQEIWSNDKNEAII